MNIRHKIKLGTIAPPSFVLALLFVCPAKAAAPVTGGELLIGSNNSLNPTPNWNMIAGGLSNINNATGEGVIAGGFYNRIDNNYGHAIGGGATNVITVGSSGGPRDYNVIAGGNWNSLLDVADVGCGTISTGLRSPSL